MKSESIESGRRRCVRNPTRQILPSCWAWETSGRAASASNANTVSRLFIPTPRGRQEAAHAPGPESGGLDREQGAATFSKPRTICLPSPNRRTNSIGALSGNKAVECAGSCGFIFFYVGSMRRNRPASWDCSKLWRRFGSARPEAMPRITRPARARASSASSGRPMRSRMSPSSA